jgi:signal transduction histidine kinase
VNPPEDVPFNDIVNEAVEFMQGPLATKNLSIAIAENLPVVYGDQARLVEVVQNLLDNAVKFIGDQPNPRIEIGQAGDKDGQPIFYVKDNGIGIAPEYHERIFGLFDKLDLKMEGTGVGLSLVKRTIEVHGGRIWVESELGKGATFYFTLPVSSALK